jgi:hypothetical protein
VLSRIFGPKREEVAGGWRKQHNEKFHNLCTSLNMEGDQIKENEMGRICSMHKSEREEHIKFWLRNPKGRDHTENLGIDGRIISECILRKQGGKVQTGCIWLRIGTSGQLL